MLSAFRMGAVARPSLALRAAARCALIAAGAAACLTPRDVVAATILYRTDAQLVALAERVVLGRVLDTHAERDPVLRTIYTVARIAVLEDLTGGTEPVIEVRELGGRIGGVQMSVPGTPALVPGQELVLLLERRGARWRTVALEFSAFSVTRQPDGDAVLTRDAAGSHVIGAPVALAGAAPGAASGAAGDGRSRLLSELRGVVRAVKGTSSTHPGGERAIEEAAAAAAGRPGGPVSAPYTLLADMRWREADSDTPVVWYRNPSAPPPVTDPNPNARIQLALQSWTAPSSARITLTFGGDRGIGGGEDVYCPASVTGAGLMTFEDPNNEMGPGILAIGGGCTYAGSGHAHNGQTFEAMSNGFTIFNNASETPTLRDPLSFTRVMAHELGHGLGLGHTCEVSPVPGAPAPPCQVAMRANLMYPSCCFTETPLPPAIGPDDLAGVEFLYPAPVEPEPPTDADNDTLPDAWELEYGLLPNSSTGDNGPTGDPDGDGLTNAQELAAHTHPRGFHERFFAEGVTNAFFETQIALLNPNPTTDAIVLLRIQPQTGDEQPFRIVVPRASRRTVSSSTFASLTSAPFATLIESDQPVVADRTVNWGGGGFGPGSHTETAVLSPATTWYLAEGATGGPFELFYLVQNSNTNAVQVDITYLRPGGQAPLRKRYDVPGQGRLTIQVDYETFPELPGEQPLSATDLSATVQVVAGGGPVIVERALYYSQGGQIFGAGHESAGVTAPDDEWFFAEGATGSFFDTYVLIANPGTSPAQVTAKYLLRDGQTISESYTIAPQSRFTIWVDEEEIPKGSGIRPLQSVEVSTTLTSNVPIVAERAMWWPQGVWYEAHNAAGATESGTRWAIADGESGGAREAQTYLLVANVSDQPASVRVTVMTEAGQTLFWPSATGGITVAAHSRTTIGIDPGTFPGIAGQRFGAVVESLNGQQVVVERANYFNVDGVFWAAGGAALAARLNP